MVSGVLHLVYKLEHEYRLPILIQIKNKVKKCLKIEIIAQTQAKLVRMFAYFKCEYKFKLVFGMQHYFKPNI